MLFFKQNNKAPWPSGKAQVCKTSIPRSESEWRLQCVLTKKMPRRKPEIFSGFLRFTPFSLLFRKSNFSENKKMPIGVFEQGSRSEPLPCLFRGDICDFSSQVSPLFSLFSKKSSIAKLWSKLQFRQRMVTDLPLTPQNTPLTQRHFTNKMTSAIITAEGRERMKLRTEINKSAEEEIIIRCQKRTEQIDLLERVIENMILENAELALHL